MVHFLDKKVTISGLSKTVTLHGESYDGIIIVALYDNLGRFIDIEKYTPQENISVDLPATLDYSTAKVIWWESLSSLKPLCESKTISN